MSELSIGGASSLLSDHRLRLLDITLVATAASATVLLFSPANVYYGNALEFPLRFRDALPYLLLLTATATCVMAGLVCLLKTAWRGRAVSLLLGVAVLAWIQGNLLTWSYGWLDGHEIDWSAIGWRRWVDGAMWLAILSAAVLAWRAVVRYARAVAIALLALQLAGLGGLAYTSDGTPSYTLHDFDYDVKYRFSSKRNVVVLVLDGLQGTEFGRVIAYDPTLASALDGFTYFRDAVADFPLTQGSLPAILTARRYDNSQSYTRFIEEAYDSPSSLPKALRRHGFIVDVYGLSRALWSSPAILSNLPVEPGGLRAFGGNLAFLVDLGLFRCIPHQLKSVVYARQSWLLLRLAACLGIARRTPMAITGILPNAMFMDELNGKAASGRLENDPVFKFFHLQGPHPPLSIDETGRPAHLPFTINNYRRAVAGSMKIAGLLLDLLRRRGLYDASLILVVSDHGSTAPVALPPALAAGAGDQGPTGHSRALPLVLVKPLRAHGALRVSDAPVQLSDIPKTVLSQLGFPSDGVPGLDMLTLRDGEHRERVHYAVLDTNWFVGRHLSTMTEYTVDGHSWYARSWKATGRVLGDSRDALETYRTLARLPLLDELSAASSSGDDPVVTVSNDGELLVSFPPRLVDPRRGDFATVTLPLRGLKPGTTYRLAFDLQDRYGGDWPGRLMQMAWLDDRLIYANDIGAGTFTGARSIEWLFCAASKRAKLRLDLRAIGDPERGWRWGEVTGIALAHLRLEPAGPGAR
jgi:hypothetical protein